MRYNPFNPQQPARPDFFVGREPEIEEFEKFLVQTMHNSPMNMSITGNRGMGKTSILMKFEQIAKEKKCIVVRLSNYEGNVGNIVELADFITSNLKREILSKRPIDENFDKLKKWMSGLKPTIEWNDVSLSLEKRQIVQEMFRARLDKLWDEIKKDYPACVILFDEAESLEKIEGALAFIREVFQRTGMACNYMVVLAGKLNFPERMSESFSPLNRFFPCSKLTPFKDDDIKKYILDKLRDENVTIDAESIAFVAKNSEGHPYVLVTMCYLVFDTLREEEEKITLDTIKRSKEKISAKLSQDFFYPMYYTLSPKAKDVLKAICMRARTLEFNFSESVAWTKLSRNYASPYIQELSRKGIINKLERGKYQVFHKLFKNYVNRLEHNGRLLDFFN